MGLTQRSVWFHDASGERQISLEGYAFYPLLSADGQKVCFRVSRATVSGQSPTELWMADLGSRQNAAAVSWPAGDGLRRVASDRVVAAVVERDGRTGLWLAWLDGREPPRRIPQADGDNPRFGRDGEILFRVHEKDTGVLYRILENGEGRERIAQITGTVFGTVSPDGEWLSSLRSESREMILFATGGGASRPLFPSSLTSRLRWSLDGRRAYLSMQYGQSSGFAVGRTYVLPVALGSVLPRIPPNGFQTEAEIAVGPGVQVLPYGDLAPGPSPSIYAFSRETTTRNLYRIPLE